ncbi:uncharacterized protein LOC117288756 [Asterias rubens]|uniref:uncharacterized protein LOC117288756 n=1 Tax=Asterias rubens TaxID=7604 RepID=UPI001454E660|nr:uncharacterized protein LOC117288756 [Asterias rubens]XP_033625477.1 uncharacterized protein LOC117288756 [Asterias rubens]
MDSQGNRWAMNNALHHFTAPGSDVRTPGLSGNAFGMQEYPGDSAPQRLLPTTSCQSGQLGCEDNTNNFQKHPTGSLSSNYSDHNMSTQPSDFSWDTEIARPNLLNFEGMDSDRIEKNLPAYPESRQVEPEAFEEDMSWTSDILSADSQMNLDDQSFETNNEGTVEQSEASLVDELLFSNPITKDITEPRATQKSSAIFQQISPLRQFSSALGDESIDMFKAAWEDADETDSQLAINCQDSFAKSCNSFERDLLALSIVQKQVPGSPLHSDHSHSWSSTAPSQEQNIKTDMPEDLNMQDPEKICMDDLSEPLKPSGIDPSNIHLLDKTADLSIIKANSPCQHHTGKEKDPISDAILNPSNRITDMQNVTEQRSEEVINTHGMLDVVESQVEKDQFSVESTRTDQEQSEIISSIRNDKQSQSNQDKENVQDVDEKCKDRSIEKQNACLAPQPSVVTQPTESDTDILSKSPSSPLSEGSIMFLSDIDDQNFTDDEQDVQTKENAKDTNDDIHSILFKATEPDPTTCIADEPSREESEDDRECEARMSVESQGDDKSSDGVDDARRQAGKDKSSMQCRENKDTILSDTGEDIKVDSGNILNVNIETENDAEEAVKKNQVEDIVNQSIEKVPEIIKTAGQESLESGTQEVYDLISDDEKDSLASDEDTTDGQGGDGMIENKHEEDIVDQSIQKVPEIKTAGQGSLESSTEEVCDLISDNEKDSDDNTLNGQDTSKQCESGNIDDQSLREGSPLSQEGDADCMMHERDNNGKHDRKEDKDSEAKDQENDSTTPELERTIDEHSESEHKDQEDIAKPQEGDSLVQHKSGESHGDGRLAKEVAPSSDCSNINQYVDKSQEPICLSDSDEEQILGLVPLSGDSVSGVCKGKQIAQSHVEATESDSILKENQEDGQEVSDDDDVLVVENDAQEVISVDDSSDEDDASTHQTTEAKNSKAANDGKKVKAKNDWSCQICGSTNKSLNSLKLHVRRSHNLIMVHRKEEMKCKMCSFAGTWQKIKEHIIKDHQTPLKWYVKNQETTEITKLPASGPELPEDSLLAQPVLVDLKASDQSKTADTSPSGSNRQIYLIKKVTSIEEPKKVTSIEEPKEISKTSGPGRPLGVKTKPQQSRFQTMDQLNSLIATSVLSKRTQGQQIAPKKPCMVNSSSQPSGDPTLKALESSPGTSVLTRASHRPAASSFLAPGTFIHDSGPSVRTMTVLTARPDTDLHDNRRAVVNRELSAKVREVFQQQTVGGPPLVTKISGTTYVISSTNAKVGLGLKAPQVTTLSQPNSYQIVFPENITPKMLQEAANKQTSPQQGQAGFVVRSVSSTTPNVLSISPPSLNTAFSVPVTRRPDTIENQQPFQMTASNDLRNAATMSTGGNLPPVSAVPAVFNHEYCRKTVALAVTTTVTTTTASRVVQSPKLTSIDAAVAHANIKSTMLGVKPSTASITQDGTQSTMLRVTPSTVPINPTTAARSTILKTPSVQNKPSAPGEPAMVSYVIKVPKAQSNGPSKDDEQSYLVKVPVNQTNVSKKLMVHLPVDKTSLVKHAVCIVQPPLHTSDSGANPPAGGKPLQSIRTDTPSLVTNKSQTTGGIINSRIGALATSSPPFVQPKTVPVLEPIFEPVGESPSRVSFLANLKEPALDIQLLKSQFEDTNTFNAADLINIDERVQYECARCKEYFPQLVLLQLHHIDCTTHPPAGNILPIVHVSTAMLASFFTVSTSGYSSACILCSTLLLGNARNVEDQQDFSSHLSKHTEPSVAITCLDDTRKLGILQTRMTSQQAKEWVDFIAPPFRMGNKPTSTQEGNLEEFINTTGILHQESMLLRKRSRRYLQPEHDRRQSKHKQKKHKHKHRHSRDHELARQDVNQPYRSSIKTQEGCEGEWIEPTPKGSSSLLVRKKSRPGSLKQSITSSPSQPKPQLPNLTPMKGKNLAPSKVRQRFLNVSVPGRRSLRGLGLDFGMGLEMLPLDRKKRKDKSPNSENRLKGTERKQTQSNLPFQLPDTKIDEVIEIFSSDEEMGDTLPYDEQRRREDTPSTSASPINSQKHNLEEPDDLYTKKLKGNSGELSANDVDSDKEKMNVDDSDSKDANYSDNVEGEDSSSDDDDDEENANENRSNVDHSEREVGSEGEDASPADLPLSMIALHYQRVNKDMESVDMDCDPSTSNRSDHEMETIISKEVDNTSLEGTSSSHSQQASPASSQVVLRISLEDPKCTSARSSSPNDDNNIDHSEREVESEGEDASPADLPLSMIALHYQRVNKDMESVDLDCDPSTSNRSDHEMETIISKEVDNTSLEGTSSSHTKRTSPGPSEVIPCISLEDPTSTSARSSSSANDDILLENDEEDKMPMLESQEPQTEQVVDIRPLTVEKIGGETESKSSTAESVDFNLDRDSEEKEDKEDHTSKILENHIMGESGDVILEDTAQHGTDSLHSFPTSGSPDNVIQSDNTAHTENSHIDHPTRRDSDSRESSPTKQFLIDDFQQEDSNRSSFQQVSDLEDSFQINTLPGDDLLLDGSISPSSITDMTEDNADDSKISFEEGSIQLETISERELSKNSSHRDDLPQQDDSFEQECYSKGSFPSSRSPEAVQVEDISMNSFQEDSSSVNSFPTNKSPADDFIVDDTTLNSFQQISNFLDSSRESILLKEKAGDSFQSATRHRSPEHELIGADDGAYHDSDVIELDSDGDEITGNWFLEDSDSSTGNPVENNSPNSSSEAAARRSPLPNDLKDDSITEVGTEDGTQGSQLDAETSKSSTDGLEMKENIQSDITVLNTSKRIQNSLASAESNLSDVDNVRDIFSDNESKSSFGDGFDVEDWEEEEEELNEDEVLHLSNDEDDGILEGDPVEEASLGVSKPRSRLKGDKQLAIDDDITPTSNSTQSYLKSPQSTLNSGKEAQETTEMEESQARQLNNLKRKTESLREGDATLKRSRVEGDSE